MNRKLCKLWVVAILLLVIVPGITGCWNYREIKDLAVVMGMAVDKKDDQYKITVEIASTKGGGGGEKAGGGLSSEVYESTGNTIFEAVRNMISKTGKKLYWPHAHAIIVSQSVAKEGMVPVLDWINRDAEVRSDTWLFISKEETASEILNVKLKLFDTVSMQLHQTMLKQASTAKFLAISAGDFLEIMQTCGLEPVLPGISIQTIEEKQIVAVEGTAVFKSDKMVGWLDAKETRSLLMIRDKMKKGGLIVIDQEGTKISLEVFRNDTQKTAQIKGKEPVITIEINPKSVIAEITSPKDLIDEKGFKETEKMANRQIVEEIKKTVAKVQGEYKSDIFGFGQLVKIKHSDWWRANKDQWNNIFPELAVDVKMKFAIRGSAIMSEPTKVGE